MSMFSSNNWPPACSSAGQSPIALTTTGTKPCNLSCDLVMDTGEVSQAKIYVSDEGLILQSDSGLGTCKFRGESYLCVAVSVNHPSHHTIDGIQADGEVIAMFKKPTGELMCMSSLFRIQSTQTPSFNFFKQFVPYATTSSQGTSVTMRDWSIAGMVPPDQAYFVYQGTTLVPPCTPCEWVVFKSMINMDQDDFGYLTRNVEAGSRPIQGLGEREVFFNDIKNIPGGPMPHDNKFYLKLRPTGKTKLGGDNTNKPVDLSAKDEKKDTGTWMDEATKYLSDTKNVLNLVGGIILFSAMCWAAYSARNASIKTPFTGEFVIPGAKWTRETLWWIYQNIIAGIGYLFTAIWSVLVWMYSSSVGFFADMGKMLYTLVFGTEKVVLGAESAAVEVTTAAQDIAKAASAEAKLKVAQATQAIEKVAQSSSKF